MAKDPDVMDIMRDARRDAVEQVADLLRIGRSQVTQPLPLSSVREKPLAEQVAAYLQMVETPELALAELSRVQAERGVTKPRTMLRHLAKMEREARKRSGGNGKTPPALSLDGEKV